MTADEFVKSVKKILDERGISYSRAGRESGCGEEFVRSMERQKSAPSFIRVQKMAQYLGMTTSELLGEEKASSPAADDSEERLLILYRKLNQEGRDKLLDYADDLAESGKYKKVSALRVGTKEV